MNERDVEKVNKIFETEFDRAFKASGQYTQFKMTDLKNIRIDVETAYYDGGSIEEAMKAAVAKYRVN